MFFQVLEGKTYQRKIGKTQENVKKNVFLGRFLLNFDPWTLESSFFDLKIKIYAKNPTRNRILRSGYGVLKEMNGINKANEK